MRGTFIVLDGPDGSGTTTHAKTLAKRLKKAGFDVFETAEPSKGPIGVWIRELLKGKNTIKGMALQLLFCADRAWHLDAEILPALEKGKIVVCDRYWHSTVVYAGAQSIDIDPLFSLNQDFIQPDITIFTLPSLQVCLERIGKRSAKDAFETDAFQKKIHRLYRMMLEQDSSITDVDTEGAVSESADIIEAIARTVITKTKKSKSKRA